MKSAEPIGMAHLTAFMASIPQGASSKPVKLGFALVLVLVGLYLYLVPNSITVSNLVDMRREYYA
jgi:hypothetical protein